MWGFDEILIFVYWWKCYRFLFYLRSLICRSRRLPWSLPWSWLRPGQGIRRIWLGQCPRLVCPAMLPMRPQILWCKGPAVQIWCGGYCPLERTQYCPMWMVLMLVGITFFNRLIFRPIAIHLSTQLHYNYGNLMQQNFLCTFKLFHFHVATIFSTYIRPTFLLFHFTIATLFHKSHCKIVGGSDKHSVYWRISLFSWNTLPMISMIHFLLLMLLPLGS